jgi:hypothetical protein
MNELDIFTVDVCNSIRFGRVITAYSSLFVFVLLLSGALLLLSSTLMLLLPAMESYVNAE